MTLTTQTTPLESTLARATSLSAYLKVEVGVPTGEGWFAPAAFLEDDAVLELLWTRTSEGAKTTDRAYLKQSVFGSYLWLLSMAGIGTYLLERRVPDLSAWNTVLFVGPGGEVDRLALRIPRFACLPDDPDAADPHARTVPDLDALRRTYLQTCSPSTSRA